MRTTFIDAKSIFKKAGLSKKETYRELVRFENIVGSGTVKNKRVLEIGAGNGIFSCLMSLAGAHSVIALEPEASGSGEGVQNAFEERIRRFGMKNCRLIPATLQNYEEEAGKFDLIVAVASINHWDEEACMRLHNDKVSRKIYISLFAKCLELLNDGGRIILADVSRKNFFGSIKSVLGIPHPMVPNIEWHKHQQPKLWEQLLRDAGFDDVRWRWTCPPPLKFGMEKLICNVITAYFTASYFVLTASCVSEISDRKI